MLSKRERYLKRGSDLEAKIDAIDVKINKEFRSNKPTSGNKIKSLMKRKQALHYKLGDLGFSPFVN